MMLFTAVCIGIWQEKAAELDDGNHPPISMLVAVVPHHNPAGSLLKSASPVEPSVTHLLPIVAVDSSAARMPLPGATSCFALSTKRC
jgi:hypothetical protein